MYSDIADILLFVDDVCEWLEFVYCCSSAEQSMLYGTLSFFKN